MSQPKIRLSGTLTCPPERLAAVRAALPEHIRLTRAEPGCLSFEVRDAGDGRFEVAELFQDRTAFDAHQQRTGKSPWSKVTAGLPRDYEIVEE